jgi:hypothetical protein
LPLVSRTGATTSACDASTVSSPQLLLAPRCRCWRPLQQQQQQHSNRPEAAAGTFTLGSIEGPLNWARSTPVGGVRRSMTCIGWLVTTCGVFSGGNVRVSVSVAQEEVSVTFASCLLPDLTAGQPPPTHTYLFSLNHATPYAPHTAFSTKTQASQRGQRLEHDDGRPPPR